MKRFSKASHNALKEVLQDLIPLPTRTSDEDDGCYDWLARDRQIDTLLNALANADIEDVQEDSL